MTEAATETTAPDEPEAATEQPGTDTEGTETEQAAEDPRVKRANSEAARYRTSLRAVEQERDAAQQAQQELMAKLGAALGLTPEGTETDPAAQVGQLTTQVESLTGEVTTLRGHLLVHELARAPEANADPVALLDSRKFTDALAKLDPSADDYRDKVADAIKTAVDASPIFRAQGQAPSAGGAETAGQGAGSGAAVTADQFKSMSYADKTELAATNPALYRQLAGS